MKKHLLIFVAALGLLTACGDETSDFKGELIEVPASKDVALTTADIDIVSAMNTKGTEFFNQLVSEPEGCRSFSPLSLTFCAALYANALPANNAEAFLEWYNVPDLTTFNQSADRLIRKLYRANAENDFALANSVWYKGLAHPTPDYKKVVNSYFYSEVNKYDVANSDIINQWINAKTSGLLQKFMVDMDFSQYDFTMVNCMYFSDQWKEEFSADKTHPSEFTGLNGTTTIEMMSAEDINAQCFQNDGDVLIKLPFEHDAELLILMPRKTVDFMAYCSNLRYSEIIEMETSLTDCVIDLKLPKFKSEMNQDLTYLLERNGLNLIAKLPGLSIEQAFSRAQQLTYFNVNEKGASAATATIIAGWGAAQKKSFDINRPFVYLLKSKSTDAILMMGAITDL